MHVELGAVGTDVCGRHSLRSSSAWGKTALVGLIPVALQQGVGAYPCAWLRGAVKT